MLLKISSSRSYLLSVRRKLKTSNKCTSYESDGKTTVTILNKNFDYGLMIDNVSEQGFILNNGIRTIGPMVIFPKTMLSWNIASSLDMNEQSFSLFFNLEPKLDILVIGLDDEYPYNSAFIMDLKRLFMKYEIKTEIQSVYRACSTFNFLNSENRYAAAALIPPKLKQAKDLILRKDSQKKVVSQNISKESNSFLLEQDSSVISTCKFKQLSTEVIRKEDITESLKIRSPWKPESKLVIDPKKTTLEKKKKTNI